MTTAEDRTVILHMLDGGRVEESEVLQEANEQEVQTTILEIDQDQLGQALQVKLYSFEINFKCGTLWEILQVIEQKKDIFY